jgi:hypothetical protein
MRLTLALPLLFVLSTLTNACATTDDKISENTEKECDRRIVKIGRTITSIPCDSGLKKMATWSFDSE